ncbi:MAG: c-type cytochrome [Nitrospirae bacterium]|nr:c-type cytochrome [Nitrospirota bacterium]
MKKIILTIAVISILGIGAPALAEKPSTGNPGEEKFKEHCALCHPAGANIINAKKTLHKKDLIASKIKTEADIVKIMRTPGPGMTTFDAKTLSDKDAGEIAKYILKTFK